MKARAAAALLLAAGTAAGQGRSFEATAGEPRSLAVYPEQVIALRFSHARHLESGAACQACHQDVSASDSAASRRIPGEERCAACHDVEGARAGRPAGPPSACRDCHPGFDVSVDRAPRPSSFPRPGLHFSHARHLARGAGCAVCHGDLSRVELATRAQLPRMATCLTCHDGREASASCATCHPGPRRARGGQIETQLPAGVLRPGPGDPFGLDHGPRFERAHGSLALRERERCAACHAQSFCLRCHDWGTRPQEIHPGDYISLHPVAARQGDGRCDACHRRQSFCAACHERTGVGSEAAAAFRDPSARVHPPGWMTLGPGHHGVQAARAIGTCASCHREEQCAACHAPSTLGARTHPPGFAGRCREMIRRSDRACAKCHVLSDPGDAAGRCR